MKEIFADYGNLKQVLDYATNVSESAKLKLLRHNLLDEGQKMFAASDLPNSHTFEDAFAMFV